MIHIPRWKKLLSAFICLMGMLYALPSFLSPQVREKLPPFLQKSISLGLELQGGSHLQLEVDLDSVHKEYMQQLSDEARILLRAKEIPFSQTLILSDAKAPGGLVLKVTLKDAFKDALDVLKKIGPSVEVTLDQDGTYELMFTKQALDEKSKKVLEQSIEVIRRRVDEKGTTEPIIQRQGTNRIILQLPGVEDPAQVKNLLGKTAKMTFHMVDKANGSIPFDDRGIPQSPLPAGTMVVPLEHKLKDGKTVLEPIIINRQVLVSGETLIDSQPTFDDKGLPAVTIKFNKIGGKKFGDASVKYLHQRFAVVLDGKVITAPSFNVPIPSGSGIISGSMTVQEATQLALLLRAGALPAPLKVIEERTVGPSLGADSIHAGGLATLLAISAVAIFMMLNYSLFGVFADIALVFNIIFLMASLSILQATLTLPGIAGIALTVGMAVDANVLIYERIKEELRAGVRPVMAIEAGYKRALTTIIDSNVTTLIGAAILFEFGSGPIRGFAVTLALGILISLFTALALTRMIIVSWLKKRRVTALPI